jgi:parvulin-like peptidyl-prolyl isomerase
MIASILVAQPAQPAKNDPPPPARDLVAARVNGQPIQEIAVYRGIMNVPPQRRQDARKDVLNFLIDNLIIDQYLGQLKVTVQEKEIDEHLDKIKQEAISQKKDFKKALEQNFITEADLRTEMASALRWDKFVLQYGTDKVLQDYFKANPEMFNGSRVHARHILVTVTEGKKDAAAANLLAIKKKIDDEVGQTIGKLPPTTDAITREKERAKAIEQAFSRAATDFSSCPSKKEGGDLGLFRRAGDMVEPFARAAFALKPYQMSEPVLTDFGYHLILAIEHKPGAEISFEKAKPFVQEVYSERLREAVLTQYRAKSKIEILDVKK